MRKRLPGIAVFHDGARLESTTRLGRAGPYTVVLASTVATVDVELHSAYLGHPAVDTRAVHLELRRRGPAHVEAAEHPREELPVTYALERLVLDHAARLRDLVAVAGGGHAAVEVGDDALAAAAAGGAQRRSQRR